MFINTSNATLNNILFSAPTIPLMHPSVERLYQAAASVNVAKEPSALAGWLNESPQTITNWKKRGVSQRGALTAQGKSGYSATWILNGDGSPRRAAPDASPQAAEPPPPGKRFDAVDEREHELLENWRWLPDRRKKELFDLVARLAAEHIEDLQSTYAKHPELERMGLRAIPRTASARAALLVARNTTPPPTDAEMRQQSLLDDDGTR